MDRECGAPEALAFVRRDGLPAEERRLRRGVRAPVKVAITGGAGGVGSSLGLQPADGGRIRSTCDPRPASEQGRQPRDGLRTDAGRAHRRGRMGPTSRAPTSSSSAPRPRSRRTRPATSISTPTPRSSTACGAPRALRRRRGLVTNPVDPLTPGSHAARARARARLHVQRHVTAAPALPGHRRCVGAGPARRRRGADLQPNRAPGGDPPPRRSSCAAGIAATSRWTPSAPRRGRAAPAWPG